ncbi:FAD-dependent oxidoreductase [Streptomyces sp. ST2-7A]|uniref:FAD-dependent oxidoreductase n=1 Tax=Streptomyces sp. ST2-7A TaxID=2907214 RepID=UPI001F192532|nr:FAD-dependent oxidoreductase [Streptomyces sp. ST2-7A]MCE7079634.1 lycopene cyclase [Streptomyces sp. ST2-7A]
MRDADVVIVGAGAAGLSLAHHLCGPAGAGLRVVLVDAPPGPLRPAERTWCFWEGPDGEWDDLVTASWRRLRVRAPSGREIVDEPPGLRYKMLRSGAFEARVRTRMAEAGIGSVEAVVESVADVADGAEARGRDAAGRPVAVRGRWVLDSRPPRSLGAARTLWWQHFRGWFVRTERPVFEPAVADLMDFRTPQPGKGLSFGYVLPLGEREALVEYTEFSPAVLNRAGYERALRDYTERVLRTGGLTVTGTEEGVIPMTDARFPRRVGRAVFRIGTAGGAVRPSTGYAFAATQRQAAGVARALAGGRTPIPPPAHRPRSLVMDAVMLRALDRGRVRGDDFFTGLFDGVPMERLLRFLRGDTRPVEDLAIGRRTPVWPMTRTALELPWVRRRLRPGPPPVVKGEPDDPAAR